MKIDRLWSMNGKVISASSHEIQEGKGKAKNALHYKKVPKAPWTTQELMFKIWCKFLMQKFKQENSLAK